MTIKKIIIIVLILSFFVSPAQAENLPEFAQSSETTQHLSDSPLKSYFLNVLGGGSRQSIQLDSPATKLIIYVQQGEKPIRCGNCITTYTCTPGKPLKLNVDPATPIKKIWAENRYDKLVRLRLDIFEEVSNSDVEEEEVD